VQLSASAHPASQQNAPDEPRAVDQRDQEASGSERGPQGYPARDASHRPRDQRAPAQACRHACRTARPRPRWRSPPCRRRSPHRPPPSFGQAAPAGSTSPRPPRTAEEFAKPRRGEHLCSRPVARRAELQERAISVLCRSSGRQQHPGQLLASFHRSGPADYWSTPDDAS
jgi:hypothetical protein